MSRSTYRNFHDAVTALGSTLDDIISNLVELGIQGVPGSNGSCPVARYIISVFPDAQPMVSGYDIWDRSHRYEDCDTPDAITDFIEDFDHGHIPELVLPDPVRP